MARYQIWDGESDVFTAAGEHLTAAEWKARYPWANAPGARMIITAGPINGGCAEYFDGFVAYCKQRGAEIPDGMSDAEILAAIEDFEDNLLADKPSTEERTAAALEFLAMNSLPDETA